MQLNNDKQLIKYVYQPKAASYLTVLHFESRPYYVEPIVLLHAHAGNGTNGHVYMYLPKCSKETLYMPNK